MNTALSRLDNPEASAAYALLVDLRREALIASIEDTLARAESPDGSRYLRSCALDAAANQIATDITHHVAQGYDLLMCPPRLPSGKVTPTDIAYYTAHVAAFDRLTAAVMSARAAVAHGAAEMAVAGVEAGCEA